MDCPKTDWAFVRMQDGLGDCEMCSLEEPRWWHVLTHGDFARELCVCKECAGFMLAARGEDPTWTGKTAAMREAMCVLREALQARADTPSEWQEDACGNSFFAFHAEGLSFRLYVLAAAQGAERMAVLKIKRGRRWVERATTGWKGSSGTVLCSEMISVAVDCARVARVLIIGPRPSASMRRGLWRPGAVALR